MNMHNENEMNINYEVDVEVLRMEILIEQYESYEKEFFSMEPPADDFEHQISVYESQLESYEISCFSDDFEEEFDYLFDQEDYLMNLRDDALIEEHQICESNFLNSIKLDFINEDILELQIESRDGDEYIEENFQYCDFDPDDYDHMQYEENMFWKLHYLREAQFEDPSPCGCPYEDYMPNDDGLCDYLDCYDYPEGPNENLCGIKYF